MYQCLKMVKAATAFHGMHCRGLVKIACTYSAYVHAIFKANSLKAILSKLFSQSYSLKAILAPWKSLRNVVTGTTTWLDVDAWLSRIPLIPLCHVPFESIEWTQKNDSTRGQCGKYSWPYTSLYFGWILQTSDNVRQQWQRRRIESIVFLKSFRRWW